MSATNFEATAASVRRLAEDGLALAGMSLDHAETNGAGTRLRDRINSTSPEHSAVVAEVLAVVSQWLTDAADDRIADAQQSLRHPDPWEQVVGAAIMCETSTVNELAAEMALAAQLIRNPENPSPASPKTTAPTPERRDATGERSAVTHHGAKWYRRAWDSADADGSVQDVIAAVNNPDTATPDPAGHGRTRLSKDDVTAVVTPDGVILAWWRDGENYR